MRAYVCGWGVLQCWLIQIPETLNGHAVFCYLDFPLLQAFNSLVEKADKNFMLFKSKTASYPVVLRQNDLLLP